MNEASSNRSEVKRKSSYGRAITHGFTVRSERPVEYINWSLMRDRCRNPNNKAYKHYGGKGIQICERWDDFSAFLEDMGKRPPGGTIERIDRNKGYCPENCKWASWTEQQRNRSNNRLVTADGETKCVAEWSEISGIPYRTIMSRLNSGWPEHFAVTKPRNYRISKGK